MGRLLVHAPSVHVGGGAVLLRALLLVPNLAKIWANLDARASGSLQLPSEAECHYVAPTLLERALAEFRLFRCARADDVVLCFHGLPPLFPVKGRVVVFKQNRIHLDSDPLSMFSLRTKIRLSFERVVCKIFRSRVHEYIVQTVSMKLAVNSWHGGTPIVRVIPFLADSPVIPRESKTVQDEFIYVADGEAHKNHRTLISAWILLASEGIFPALTLTLPPRSLPLWREIEVAIQEHGLRIENRGSMTHESTLKLYRSARALIFPSTTESFGLPLLEATAAQLPIIASELDYVRDVCQPCETFNPLSARSIAAAVKRFMNIPDAPIKIRSPAEFIAEIT